MARPKARNTGDGAPSAPLTDHPLPLRNKKHHGPKDIATGDIVIINYHKLDTIKGTAVARDKSNWIDLVKT